MISSRRHPAPQKIFCPRWLAEKVGGGVRNNPWIISLFYPKSLIAEANATTGRPPFSTGRPLISTVSPVFSTGAVSPSTFNLSLYPIEKKEEERKPEGKNVGWPIHGLAQLPIFSSTGFCPVPRVFRGNPWMEMLVETMRYVVICGHPRIHVKKCLGGTWSCHA